MYIFKYIEATGRKADPWSVRQTALYHQIRLDGRRSTYILISPSPSSVVQSSVLQWLLASTSASACKLQAFTPNRLLLSSHIDGCRDYMSSYERKIEDLVSHINPLY